MILKKTFTKISFLTRLFYETVNEIVLNDLFYTTIKEFTASWKDTLIECNKFVNWYYSKEPVKVNDRYNRQTLLSQQTCKIRELLVALYGFGLNMFINNKGFLFDLFPIKLRLSYRMNT